MKIINPPILVLLSLFSITALAHQGHGESSLFAHDLEHALWYAGTFTIFALFLFYFYKRQ